MRRANGLSVLTLHIFYETCVSYTYAASLGLCLGDILSIANRLSVIIAWYASPENGLLLRCEKPIRIQLGSQSASSFVRQDSGVREMH